MIQNFFANELLRGCREKSTPLLGGLPPSSFSLQKKKKAMREQSARSMSSSSTSAVHRCVSSGQRARVQRCSCLCVCGLFVEPVGPGACVVCQDSSRVLAAVIVVGALHEGEARVHSRMSSSQGTEGHIFPRVRRLLRMLFPRFLWIQRARRRLCPKVKNLEKDTETKERSAENIPKSLQAR